MRTRLTRPQRTRWLAALALGAAVPLLGACSAPAGSTSTRDVAWVATSASVTLPGKGVTPITLSSRKVEKQVVLGSLPSALAYTEGTTGALLVVTQGDDTLHEVDLATHKVLHVAGVGVAPDAVAVAPGGTDGIGIALVANLDSNTVTPVDLGTWKPGRPIPAGDEPVAIVVSLAPSGDATVFVADFGSNQVTPIDLASRQAGAPIPVGPGPQTLAVALGQVLVGNFSNSTLTPIDISTLRAGAAIPLPLNPTGIAVAPSGATAYVCGGAGVVPLNVNGLTLGTMVSLPGVTQGIALDESGSTAWVTERAGSLVPVTLATDKVGAPIHLGGHPSAIVIGAS